MKFFPGWILFASFVASAAASAHPADEKLSPEEIANRRQQPLSFLDKSSFCFRDEIKFDQKKREIDIPTKSARVKCSLRQNTVHTRIGRCPRSDDVKNFFYTREDERANPAHKAGEKTEEYLAELKRNPRYDQEAAPRSFTFGSKPLRDDGRNYVSGGPFLKFKKEMVVTQETKKSVAARRKRVDERVQAQIEAVRAGNKLPPRTREDIEKERAEDFRLRQFETKQVPLNEWAIAVKDSDFPAFVCYPKNKKDKKFNMETDMNVGDLHDALKSRISFSMFPEPAPAPKTQMVNDSRKKKSTPKKAPASTSGQAG